MSMMRAIIATRNEANVPMLEGFLQRTVMRYLTKELLIGEHAILIIHPQTHSFSFLATSFGKHYTVVVGLPLACCHNLAMGLELF